MQFRCGGIFSNRVIANLTHNIYQRKNFENPSIFVKVTANDKVGRFLRHSVVSC